MADLMMSVALGATLGAVWEKTVSRARSDLTALSKEMREAKLGQSQIKEAEALQKGLAANRAEIGKTTAELDKLGLKYKLASEAGDKGAKKLGAEYDKTAEHLAKLNDRQRDQQQRLDTVNGKLREAGINTRNLAGESARLGKEYDANKARLDEQNTLLSRRRELQADLLRTMAKRAAAFALLGKSARESISSEHAFTDVTRVVAFTAGRAALAQGQLAEAAAGLADSDDQLSHLAATLGQAGFGQDQLVGATVLASKMGTAFGLAGDQAAAMMAKWRRQMGLTTPQVQALADQITALGDGTLNPGQIATVVDEIFAMGEAAGADAKTIAALAASMKAVEPQAAATGVRELLLTLTKGASVTQEQAEGFDALGLSAEKMARLMATDAQRAILILFQQLGRLPKADRLGVLQQLVSKRALSAIAPMLDDLGALRANMNLVNDSSRTAGATQKAFEHQMGDTTGTLTKMRNAFSAMSGNLGSAFLPLINAGAKLLTAVALGITAASNAAPGLTNALMLGGTALLTYGIALRAVRLAATFLPRGLLASINPIKLFGGAFGGLRTAAVFSLTSIRGALIGTGIGAIVVGIGMAVAAVVAHWDRVSAFFSGFADGLGRVFQDMGPLGDAILWVADGVGKLIKWFTDLFTPVESTTAELGNARDAGVRFGENVGAVFKWLLTPINAVLEAVKGVWDWFGKVLDKAGEFFKSVREKLGGPDLEGVIAREITQNDPTLSAGYKALIGGSQKDTPKPGDSQTGTPQPGSTQGEQAPARTPWGQDLSLKDVAGSNGKEKKGRGAGQVNQNNSFRITVNAAPGMNEQDLAQRVADTIAAQQRAQARRQRSGMYDQMAAPAW